MSKVLSVWCNTLTETFFTWLKTVFDLVNFDAFSCFRRFLFHFFHIGKMFPFEDFFQTGETRKKSAWGKIRWMGRVEHGGHAVFGQKLLSTQRNAGGCTCKSLILKWANILKESSKKIHWSRIQLLTTMLVGTPM